MTTYVALLHSIVLGPGKRLVMTDLKAMAAEIGFANPRTWLPVTVTECEKSAVSPAMIRSCDELVVGDIWN